ncbi:MAG: hypothetical protein GC200_02130 [Tepidisphaera sp.]|nr:hypothetical protein [Tepidisphaera sp.]
MIPRDQPSPAAMLGVVLLIASLGVRLYSSVNLYPGFDIDPTVLASPILGLTPSLGMACDLALTLGAGLLLLALAARGERPALWELTLFLLGVVGVSLHVFRRDAWFGDATLGASWTSAIFAGLAARVAGRDPTLRTWLLAGLLGLLPTLALKGGVQVSLDHPDTYREFLAHKSDMLAAHGWTPDSPMAKAFERRISQPEATGWFGLANVLSTLMACGSIAFVGLSLTRRFIDPRLVRTDPFRRTWFVTSLLCAALCIAATAWAGSKGGYAVLAGGLALLALAMGLATRANPAPRLWRRLTPALGLLAVFGPIALVALRGVIGTRLHELSLLVRAFYQVGAARVFLAHPLFGVGPSEFKDAYTLVKRPIATEDVSSPHCLLLDHAATLGVFGLAWCALWIAWAMSSARSLAEPDIPQEPAAWSPMRPHLRLLGLAIAIPIVVSNFLEAAATTPTVTAIRIGGLLLGVLAAGSVVRLSQARPGMVRLAAAVAALGAIAHCQIELTGVTPGAQAWVLLLLGVSAAPAATQPARQSPPSRPRAAAALPALIALLATLALPVFAFPRVLKFDLALRDAYDVIAPFRELTSRMNALQSGSPQGDTPAQFAKDLSAAHAELSQLMSEAKRPLPQPPSSVPQALAQVQVMSAALCEHRLYGAWQPIANAPSVVVQSLSRLLVAEADALEVAERLGAPFPKSSGAPENIRSAAVELAANLSRTQPTASNLGWLGTLCQGLLDQGSNIDGLGPRALNSYRLAALKTPYSPLYPSQAALLAAKLGRHDEAREYARTALELDHNMQLDPLAGLPESTRSSLEKIIAAAPENTGSDQTPIKSPSSHGRGP